MYDKLYTLYWALFLKGARNYGLKFKREGNGESRGNSQLNTVGKMKL